MHQRKKITHSKPTLETDDLRAVQKALDSGMIAASGLVSDFEKAFCRYVEGKYSRAASSGKDALILALLAAGLESGDEVILPTYICRSVFDAVKFVDAKPVLVDVAENYCIDPAEVKKHITRKTKAVLVAHMFGMPAPIEQIKKNVTGMNICVIEDCAHALGQRINGRMVGSLGDLSFFSFHATKLLTTGEGGMLVVNNPKYEDRLRKLDEGSRFFSMSDLQAALGLSQLKKINAFVRKRERLATWYREHLANMPDLQIPRKTKGTTFFRFPVRIRKRFDFLAIKQAMDQRGVHVRQGVDLMLHQIAKAGSYPCADRLFKETISLPIYPSLKIKDIQYIVSCLKIIMKEL
jgi:perosamine synthetase